MYMAHTSVRTSNMERSMKFYTELLDMKFVRSKEIPKSNAEIAFLESENGNLLELTWYRDQKVFKVPEYEEVVFDHIAFVVEDMDGLLEECRKRQVTITDEPFYLTPGGSRLAFIEDPDGTLIELLERPKPSRSG
ncbi:MAG: VOC family protein [Thermoplasmata archaeon]